MRIAALVVVATLLLAVLILLPRRNAWLRSLLPSGMLRPASVDCVRLKSPLRPTRCAHRRISGWITGRFVTINATKFSRHAQALPCTAPSGPDYPC